ncbi:MAG: ABC transporter permease, partial [Chloroflexota bacterium]
MSSVEQRESVAAQQSGSASAGAQRTLSELGERRTYLGMALRRFRRNKLAVTGTIVLIMMILVAIGAGLISEYVTHKAPNEQSLLNSFAGVGEDGYILGADNVGRDILTRLAYGARISLGIAGMAIVAALTIGATVGLVAGFYGGWVDSVLMRFVDMMLSIPTLFLLLLITTLWSVGPFLLALVIASVAWVTLSRLVRGEVISVKNREYVEAARVVGAADRRVILRHILPNVAPVIIV